MVHREMGYMDRILLGLNENLTVKFIDFIRIIVMLVYRFVVGCKLQKHCLAFLPDTDTLVYGYTHHIQRFVHMFQDKGLCTYFSYTLCFLDNQYLIHILAYILCTGLLGIHLNTYIHHCYKERLDHTAMDYTDLNRLELE